jgi:hypothetical protein
METLLKNKYIWNISLWDNNIIIHFKEWYENDAQCKFISESKTYNWLYVIIWVKTI